MNVDYVGGIGCHGGHPSHLHWKASHHGHRALWIWNERARLYPRRAAAAKVSKRKSWETHKFLQFINKSNKSPKNNEQKEIRRREKKNENIQHNYLSILNIQDKAQLGTPPPLCCPAATLPTDPWRPCSVDDARQRTSYSGSCCSILQLLQQLPRCVASIFRYWYKLSERYMWNILFLSWLAIRYQHNPAVYRGQRGRPRIR